MNPDPIWPTFIVAGAARSGTTSLYNWLAQHSQVFMSPIKETNYFARLQPNFTGPGDEKLNAPLARDLDGTFKERRAAIVTSWEDYLDLFASSASFAARGEASPSYLYYPAAVKNIQQAIPDCKILIVLRNPIERAFSHYKALVRWGREHLDFESALEMEQRRLRCGWEWCWALKGVGLYASQVERYLEVFSTEQVGIWRYEMLKRAPERFYRQVCEFIGVEGFSPDLTPRNLSAGRVGALKRFLTRHPRFRQALRRWTPDGFRATARAVDMDLSGRALVMRPQTRAQLKAYFCEDIGKLDRLVPELNVTEWLEE